MNGTIILMFSIIGIIALIIIILAVTNRIVFKMAARNFARRKAQSVIVIAGLMIGTAIISSALVVQDTMTYAFEVDVYYSLGEIDEEIRGYNSFGSYVYFSDSVYDSITNDLQEFPEVEAVAPVITEQGSVLNWNTKLGEPSTNILGLDSQIMRTTSFGDLDDNGFYTDSLATGEIAINSRLADDLDAKVGHVVQLSYGAKNQTNPLVPELKKGNFTIKKIISERELWGKANYRQQKNVFIELATLQQLLNRPAEINNIWISNKGDHEEGERYSDRVNEHIQSALDSSVGLTDLGLVLDSFNDTIVLSAVDFSPFPLHNGQRLFELEEVSDGAIMHGLLVPTLTLNNIPTNNRNVMGVASTDPNFPVMDKSNIHVLSSPWEEFNLANDTQVTITTITLTGMVQPNSLTAYSLGPEHESFMPEQLRAITLGVMNFNSSQLLVHQGAFGEDMSTFVMLSGLDISTINQTRLSLENKMNEDIKGEDLNLEVLNEKADNLEFGRSSGEGIGTLFLIFGMFSIIAGIVLIINIFVMLGEERKSEMGMARAVGMKSKHLVRMYIFEGSLYAFVASFIGAFLGLGFGWGIIQAFELIFGDISETSGESFNLPFFFTWDSVIIAFTMGLLITFLTIIFISTRITKLNIIRAIRRIPEPFTSRTKQRTIMYGVLLLFLGILACLWGYGSSEGAGWMIGLPFVFIGSALVAYKWVSLRGAITVASFLIIFFMIPPFDIPIVSEADYSGAEAFVLSGVFLVLAGVFIVMFNSKILLKALQGVAGRGKSTRAVLKTAISYPMDSKFKTAMTLGMFALIIFTVTVIAMIASMQASQGDAMLEEQSGGYDIIGVTNLRTPFKNLTVETLPPELQDVDIEQLETISGAIVTLVDYDRKEGQASDFGPSTLLGELDSYVISGVSRSFTATTGFSLMERDKKFKTDREAWEALYQNDSYCIVDGTKLASEAITIGGPPADAGGVYVGGTITITDFMGQNRTRVLEVIGIMDQMFFLQGIFLQKNVVSNEYGGVDSVVMIKLGPGEDTEAVAKEFESNYLELGVQTYDLKGIINQILALSNNMMYLMEGFLGIGLLVGIAGIGIISYRNVIERRQQIGMLRAIGFKKGMITKSFLIETSFITLLATIIGILLGVGIGWTIYKDAFEAMGASFAIPWGNLLAIAIIAYIATLIFTFYPSLKASKIPPAEALRYIE
jgi:putative ABC transport system permease protein